MRATLEQHDIIPLHCEHPRHERSCEPASDNHYIAIAHTPSQALHVTRGARSPVMFHCRIRSTRAVRQESHPGSRSTSHKSAVTTADENCAHTSSAASSSRNVGGTKTPVS